MSKSSSVNADIRPVAGESLATLAKVSAKAVQLLKGTSKPGPDSSIASNTWTNPDANTSLHESVQANLDAYRTLSQEPAFARVVVVDEEGKRETFYICRATPLALDDANAKLASYRSASGRLASIPVGEEHSILRLGKSVSVQVVESARFRPLLDGQGWDARHALLEGETYGRLSVDSFRNLVGSAVIDIDESVLDDLLREEVEATLVREGWRRAVIAKMDLRDQPVLDRFQDEIFRLPLNSRLLILGAPGTGKTTTLIRRLGQKLDVAFLDADEQHAIRSRSQEAGDHSTNWLMFAPTELLKLYVKEAFNREEIPAPDERIKTWTEVRSDLARNTFGILRSAANSSSFIMRDSAKTLAASTVTAQIAWFEDFDPWQRNAFWDETRVSAASLSESDDAETIAFAGRISGLMPEHTSPGAGTLADLIALAPDIQAVVEDKRAVTDKAIRGSLNLQVNKDRTFLDQLGAFIEGLSEPAFDADDADSDDDDDVILNKVGREAAAAHYVRAVRLLARAKAQGRSVSKTSRTGRVIDWLGDRHPSSEDLADIGKSLLIQASLRRMAAPVRRYVDGIPARYRRFRRLRQAEGQWYAGDGFGPTDLHVLEVDMILLSMLRASDELIARGRVFKDSSAGRSAAERMEQLYRTQVVVDEATDFSPLQLACMATLAHPAARSFFACGDFNQRVTNWGARTQADVQWAVPNIDARTVTVAYRQSRHLHELARSIAQLTGGDVAGASLPDFVDNDGLPPVLATDLNDADSIAAWLSRRIEEIDGALQGELPSIAVLVNSEDEVRTIARSLEGALTAQNIPVVACTDGQVRGRDGAVRVFNVEHIKGLEFEAVFFVGIDKLAEQRPDVFDKFLYVGATRAATYFGLACEHDLPDLLSPLRSSFVGTW